LLMVEGGTHNNSMREGRAEYLSALHDLFGVGDPATAAPVARSRQSGRVPAS
jgi:hypothetical protein